MKYLKIFEAYKDIYNTDEIVKTITEILYELDDEGCRTSCKSTRGCILVYVTYRKDSNLPPYSENETILRIKDYMESSKWAVDYEHNYKSLLDEYDDFSYNITFEPYKYYIYNPKLKVYYNGIINHTSYDTVISKEIDISKKMNNYYYTIEKVEEHIRIIKKIDKGPFKDNMIIVNQKGKIIK